MDKLDIYEEMLNDAIAKGDIKLVESIADSMVDYCTKRGR